MSQRKEVRARIADIIARGGADRPVEQWRSDIRRMADMLLWLYRDFSKPMIYPLGDEIRLDSVPCPASSIRKSGEDYALTINGARVPLSELADTALLGEVLGVLLHKEAIDWDYWVDMVGDE